MQRSKSRPDLGALRFHQPVSTAAPLYGGGTDSHPETRPTLHSGKWKKTSETQPYFHLYVHHRGGIGNNNDKKKKDPNIFQSHAFQKMHAAPAKQSISRQMRGNVLKELLFSSPDFNR